MSSKFYYVSESAEEVANWIFRAHKKSSFRCSEFGQALEFTFLTSSQAMLMLVDELTLRIMELAYSKDNTLTCV